MSENISVCGHYWVPCVLVLVDKVSHTGTNKGISLVQLLLGNVRLKGLET